MGTTFYIVLYCLVVVGIFINCYVCVRAIFVQKILNDLRENRAVINEQRAKITAIATAKKLKLLGEKLQKEKLKKIPEQHEITESDEYIVFDKNGVDGKLYIKIAIIAITKKTIKIHDMDEYENYNSDRYSWEQFYKKFDIIEVIRKD